MLDLLRCEVGERIEGLALIHFVVQGELGDGGGERVGVLRVVHVDDDGAGDRRVGA